MKRSYVLITFSGGMILVPTCTHFSIDTSQVKDGEYVFYNEDEHHKTYEVARVACDNVRSMESSIIQ